MLRSTRLVRRSAFRRCFSSQPDHWSGVDPEYISWRGFNIVLRVLNGVPDFVSYNRKLFVSGAADDDRSTMFVLTQFPAATRVNLPDFVQDAEKAAHTVLERLYSVEQEETKQFLDQLATPDSVKVLTNKPSGTEQKKGRVVLEQLNVNSAALAGVEYTNEKVDDKVEREWLALRVQYDVTEHLLLQPEDGIEDRRAVNKQFAWTFEADVTRPEELEWAIVAATPFTEKPAAVLKAKEAAQED